MDAQQLHDEENLGRKVPRPSLSKPSGPPDKQPSQEKKTTTTRIRKLSSKETSKRIGGGIVAFGPSSFGKEIPSSTKPSTPAENSNCSKKDSEPDNKDFDG